MYIEYACVVFSRRTKRKTVRSDSWENTRREVGPRGRYLDMRTSGPESVFFTLQALLAITQLCFLGYHGFLIRKGLGQSWKSALQGFPKADHQIGLR